MNALEVERQLLRLRRILRSKFGRSSKTYFHHRVAEYRRIWGHASQAAGATLRELDEDLWLAERDGVSVRLRNHEVQLDDPVVLVMAGRKPLMHRLLADAGLRVPEHEVFGLGNLEPAYAFLSRHPRGVVVKPANGSAAGDGVSTNLTTRAELRAAALLASLYDRDMLVEAQVPGESCRALVVGGRMVHAVQRRGHRVTGDGRSTVVELIAGAGREIDMDADARFTLSWQDLRPSSVPASGREVMVKAIANLESGAREVRTIYDYAITDVLSASVRADVERAAMILDSDFVGVDFITSDPSVPLSESGGSINEVNTTPALHHHYDARSESYPAVAVEVLELAFRRQQGRHPRGWTDGT